MKLNLLFLTCANMEEAKRIAQSLLEKKLVVCAKMSNVSSSYLWKGKIESAEEVLLIMESCEENFDEAEKVVRDIHSYETFTLISTPVNKTTSGVLSWVEKELKTRNL